MKKTTLRQVALKLALVAFVLLAPLGLRAQNQLNEGFEGSTFPPDDWTSIHVSGANNWAKNTTYKHSGNASAYAHWANAGHENYFITPKLVPATGESLSFFVSAQNYSGTTLTVEVSTTNATAASFTTTLATYTTGSSGTIGTTSQSTWVEKTIDLSAYVGQEIYIAFHVIDDNGGDVIIDDVTGVSIYVPACPKPTNLTNNATDELATLSWTSDAESWNLKYKVADDADYTEETGLTTTSYEISVAPQTTYQWMVQAVCSGTPGDYTNPASFTSPCAGITTFPWTETFNSLTAGIPNCWDNSEGTTTNESYKWNYYATGHDGAGLRFNSYSNSNGNTNFLKTPPMNFPAGQEMQLVFWYKNPTGDDFSVYISTDGGSTYTTALATGLTGQSTWKEKEINLTDYVGAENVVIVFKGTSNCGYGDAYIYLDDVTVRQAPSCLAPTGLAATPSTTSAELSWNANSSETAWTIYYKKATDENYTEVSNVTENPYTLPDLDHSSNYQFYVVANCSATDNSEASDVKTFTTECAAISALGYSANFDDYPIASAYTPSSRTLPLCWKPINECTYSSYMNYPSIYYYSSTDYSNSSPNSLRFYSYYSSTYDYDPQPQYAILPEMNDLTGKRITLQARGTNSSSTFKVGTMSDPTDASSFMEITNSENPAAMTTSYQEYIFDIPSTTNRYVAIMIEAANSTRTTNGVYIDDIVFTLSPTCYKPTEAHADVADANNATISWTPDDRNVAGGSYSILDAEFNVVEDADNLTGTSFALTGLTQETSYTYYVRTNCFNTAENVEDVVVSFSTPADCAAPVLSDNAVTDITAHNATVTWTGFTSNDEYAVHYRSAAYLDGINEEFNGTSLPAGWAQYSGVLDNVLAGTATLSSETSWYYTSYGLGSYNWKINVYYTKNAWMVTPSVNIPANCALSFDVALTKYNDNSEPPSSKMPDANSKFIVLASNDNMSTWTVLREWNNTGSSDVLNNISNTANNFTIDLSGYEGDDVRVAFYVECASGPDCDLHIDNVTIGAAIPAGDWQTVTPNPTTTSTTLTGLTAKTPYEVKVNGVCNGSEEGNGSNIQSFITTVACPDPTNLAYSNVAAHTADLTWNVNGNPTTNYVLTKNGEESNIVVTINEGVASYTIANLNGETAYTVKVKANCGELDGYSSESNEKNFTTQISCHAPTDFVASGETTTSMVLSWTNGSEGQDAWVIAYKKDGDADFTEKNVTTNPYTLGELEDGKTYTLKIRANCGETDGMSQWSGEITHATEASCATPTDITVSDVNGHGATISWTDAPVEGKNYIVMVASENMALNVDFENNSIPSNFTNDANYPWYVYTGTDCTTKAMRSSNNGFNNSTSAIEVTVNVTEASTLSFDFWSRGEGTSTYWDKSIFYIDNVQQFERGETSTWESYNAPIAVGSHTLKWEYTKDNTTHKTGDCFYVDNIKITAGTSDYAARPATTATSLELNDLDPETTYYVKVIGDCGSATSPESDVETFTTPAACNAPTSLTYDDESVTAHTVDLSWTENNGATAWKVVYSKTNINNSETTIDIDENDVTINGTTINYPLTGLDGETNYTVRVKSNCGGVHNDISAESNSTSFTTLPACYPVGDVITSDITAYSVTVHWTDAHNAGAYVIKQGENVLDGTTTPSVVIDAENHTAVISGLEPQHPYTNGTFKVFADCGSEGMSATGTNVPYFQTEPSCHPVTDVTITGKTTNSVTFTWQDTHTPETYIVKEGEEVLSDVTAPHSVVIDATNHTATISGLDENETYSAGTFKVFADCGSTDGQSAGVNVPAFTTPCEAQTISAEGWTENFDNYTGNSTSAFIPTGYPNHTMPNCWKFLNMSTGSYVYPQAFLTTNSGYPVSGNCLFFKSSNTTPIYAILPEFTSNTSDLAITFTYRNEGINESNGTIIVGYMTDPDDANTFEPVLTCDRTTTLTTKTATFIGAPNGSYIAFKYQGGSSNNYYASIDDIFVYIPTTTIAKTILPNKWYAISSPVHNSNLGQTVDGVTNLSDGSLYGYTEANGTWNKPSVLETGKGYIYRRGNQADITFSGIANSNNDKVVDVTASCPDIDLKGFNLLGNPFDHQINYSSIFYKLDANGSWIANDNGTIDVAEGFLIHHDGSTNSVTLMAGNSKSQSAPAVSTTLTFTVSNGKYTDVAYAKLDNGDALPKIGHLEANAPALSIPVNGMKYAIASLGNDCESFDMTFSGKGEYTLSVDARNSGLSYVHLIDKVTGSDIDLLRQPSYHFSAGLSDLTSRFLVKLVPGDENVSDGDFAFWNGRGWTVEGEGTLQVFDALGRRILAKEVNSQLTIDRSQFPGTGVYILRLGEKTQKIVVR